MRLFDYDPDIFMEDWIASGKIKPKEAQEHDTDSFIYFERID